MGWFKIKSQADGQVITICGGASSNEGAEIHGRRDQNTDNQLWKWNGQMLVSKHRGYVMEMMGDSNSNGWNIEANHQTGEKDQQWQFEETFEGGGFLRNLGNRTKLTKGGDAHFDLVYVNRRSQKPMEEFVDEEGE